MSQPNWDGIAVGYDVLIAWNMERSGYASYEFRFGSRTVDMLLTGDDSIWGGLSNGIVINGTYAGNIIDISPIRQSVGEKIRPKIVFSTVTLTLARDCSEEIENLVAALDEYKNFAVKKEGGRKHWIPIFLTERGTKIDKETDLVFVGVPKPESVKITSDRIEITMSDALEEYSKANIFETFEEEDWPDIDQAAVGEDVPIMWGNFVWFNTSGYPKVNFKLKCIDKTYGDPGYFRPRFKLCTPGPYGIACESDTGNSSHYAYVYRFNSSGEVVYKYRANFEDIKDTGIFNGEKVDPGDSDPPNWSDDDIYYLEPSSGYEIINGNILKTLSLTDATLANPCTVTCPDHGLDSYERVLITDVQGMTDLNGFVYTVIKIDDDTLQLKRRNGSSFLSVDSSGFSAYTGNGSLHVIATNPADIWYMILKDFAGVEENFIDDSWQAVRDQLRGVTYRNYFRGHRYQAGNQTLMEILNELCGEFGMMTFIKNGKFALYLNRMYADRPVDLDLYPCDILKDKFSENADPGREQSYGLRIYFAYDQQQSLSDQEYEGRSDYLSLNYWTTFKPNFEKDGKKFFNSHKIVDDENFITDFTFSWFFEPAGAAQMASKYYYNLVENDPPLRSFETTVVKRLMNPERGIGDVVCFHHPAVGSEPVYAQIYEMNRNLMKGLVEIKAIEVDPEES